MRLHVHGEAAVPVVVVDAFLNVGEVCHPRPACVADDSVEAAHGADGFCHEVLHGGLGADVRLEEVESGVLWGGVSRGDRGEFIEEGLSAAGVGGVVYYLLGVSIEYRKILQVSSGLNGAFVWSRICCFELTTLQSGAITRATCAPNPAVLAVMRTTF